MRDRPIYDLFVKIFNLCTDIIGQVASILIIDCTHNDLELIGRLFVNYVSLRLAPVIDSLPNQLLDPFNILRGEESSTHRRCLPVAAEHIRLKVTLHSCFRCKPGEAGVPVIKIGIAKGYTAILSGRGIGCKWEDEIRRALRGPRHSLTLGSKVWWMHGAERGGRGYPPATGRGLPTGYRLPAGQILF